MLLLWLRKLMLDFRWKPRRAVYKRETLRQVQNHVDLCVLVHLFISFSLALSLSYSPAVCLFISFKMVYNFQSHTYTFSIIFSSCLNLSPVLSHYQAYHTDAGPPWGEWDPGVILISLADCNAGMYYMWHWPRCRGAANVQSDSVGGRHWVEVCKYADNLHIQNILFAQILGLN